MANLLLNKISKISVSILNYVSPSIVTDILLHPFDFATVLLQIGYNPEGRKFETATLVSVILQYAIFTFYIPYLLTSIQGLQFMGMPHPSIFYYVNYIYSKEGVRGCYRGLMPKICERLIMISVNERVRRSINKDSLGDSSNDIQSECNEDNFLRNIINGVCSQFFAVLASHPFHVIMVSSFAEFTYNKRSSIFELSHSIYQGDGYFGFFTGLTARLLGELLSLIFSVTYTTIINKQVRPQQSVAESLSIPPSQKTASHLVNYVTDVSRFTAFKPNSMEREALEDATSDEDMESNVVVAQHWLSRYPALLLNFLGNITQNGSPETSSLRGNQIRRSSLSSLLSYVPLTSKLFYCIMIRDFLSRKISNPFFLVCHCAIALETGWDKFPSLSYLKSLGTCQFIRDHLTPSGKKRKREPFNNFYY